MNSIKNFIYGLMSEGSPLSSKRFTGISFSIYTIIFVSAFFYFFSFHCTNLNLLSNVYEFTLVVILLVVLLCFGIATMKDILQLKSNSSIKETVKDDTDN